MEADTYFKKTHDLGYLLELAAQVEPLWVAYEQELRLVTDYSVEFRYPGASADLDIAKKARRLCKSFREVARQSLGLPK